MKGRSRSALGADALRGLLGAENLESPPAAPPSREQRSAAARPPKSGKARVPTSRGTSRRPAGSAQRPAARPAAARPAKQLGGQTTAAPERTGPPEPAPRARRTNVQGYIDARVLERARDAAFWTPGVSLSALIEQGLRGEVARLERERGEPFPPRRGPLTPGPAIR